MDFFSDDNLNTQRNENTGNTDNNSINSNINKYSSYEEESQSDNTYIHTVQNNVPRPFPNVFALFAKSLGAFSIFCAVFSIFFGSFICGGLAIILAILSKGYNTNMEKNARIGIATGIIGITLQLSLLIFSIYSILYVPEYREQFNSLYEQMTGEPLDDSINELLDEMGLPSQEGEI